MERAPGDTEALFFELSHTKRLEILDALDRGPFRLSALAVRVGISAPEADRHLRRLSRLSLVTRTPEGLFGLTPYGRLIRDEKSSVDYLARNRSYLRTHDLSTLPRPFVRRLPELSEGEGGENFTDSLRHTERVLAAAEEFAWFSGDQLILKEDTVREAARKLPISVRVILPSSIVGSPIRGNRPSPRRGFFEVRTLPDVNIGIAMNENLAGICFAGPSGRIDYAQGFRGKSKPFLSYCRDLFEFLWSRSRTFPA
jgi:predicted transcriptional regulator